MLNREFEVAGRKIGPVHPCYVIAEAGSNHNQSLDTALRLIDVAAKAGCDAVKFQMFDTSELYRPDHELYANFKSVELSPDWLDPLKKHANGCGLTFFASVFDRRSVDRMAAVNVPAFKIASAEATKLGLVAYIAALGKPLFISTGMCDLVDVLEVTACCERNENHNVGLMQCIALYPAEPKDVNLAAMDTLRNVVSCPVGFSDHTLGATISVAAVARGARIIEKHFTLDRSSKGPDHFYALEPNELSEMVRQIRDVDASIGDGIKAMHAAERRVGRRFGLYAARDIRAGDKIALDAIAVRQPAVGISARHRDQVMELVARQSISAGLPIRWEDLKP